MTAPNRTFAAVAVLLMAAAPLFSQFTPVSGALSDATTGPLLSGQVYRAVGSISISAGQTLTMQPGAILKMGFDTQFNVAGTFNANGTAGQPCRLTSDADDSVGGDTNGNGPSSGAPDQWRNLTFASGATANLNYLTVRYGGRFSNPMVQTNGAPITLSHCTLESSSVAAFSMSGVPAAVTVTNCAFNANASTFSGIPLASLAGFAQNTATGNAGPDSLLVGNGTIATNVTVPAAAMINGAIVLDASVVVQTGATLTLGAGLVAKVRQLDHTFTVQGALVANGTASQPVVWTTFTDDSYAGDTNEDGPSSVGTDFWRAVEFAATAAPSTLNYMVVRGGGRFSYGSLRTAGSRVNAANCVFDHSSSAAFEMLNTTPAAGSTFSNCAFTSSYRAVANATMNAVPMFLNCTAGGNTSYDSIEVTTTTVSGSVTIQAPNMISGTIVILANPTIPAGASLTLGPGVVLKNSLDMIWTVNGAFYAAGTTGSPAIVTGIQDDAYAGDTNKDGASIVAPDHWRGFYFNPGSGPSVLAHLTLRGGGRFSTAGFNLAGGAMTATDCIIDRFSNAAVDVQNAVSNFQLVNCAFTNSGIAVRNCHVNAIANFQNCQASGNSQANTIVVSSATVSGTATIAAANMISGCVRFDVDPNVPAGAVLNLNAGVVLKMTLDRSFVVDGTLNVQSGAGTPVVITDMNDDSYAGDTNLNGSSGSQKDFWRGLFLNGGSGASSIEGLLVRGAGRFGNAVVRVLSNATLIGVVIDNGSNAGLSFGASTATPVIHRLTLTNNSGYAMDQATWANFENVAGVQSSANGFEAARVTSSVSGADADVYAAGAPGGVIVSSVGVQVAAGERLRLHPGVIVKLTFDAQINIFGGLDALGSGMEPVVFTTYADDDFGGDTAHDGFGTAQADYWRKFEFLPSAAASALDHVLIRGAGRFSSVALTVASPLVSLNAVRVERCSYVGFAISALAGDFTNSVAFQCGSTGMSFTGGGFDCIHATVAACGGFGISKTAAFTGSVKNSIAWGNTSGEFQGFTVADLFASDGAAGLAGQNGNLHVNPLFANQAGGDLSLAANSPCLGAADPGATAPLVADHDDRSRVLDAGLTGIVLPDMGAYELGNWHLSVTGPAEMGEVQTYELTGATLGFGALFAGTGQNTAFSNPYGYILADAIPNLFVIAFLPTGQPFSVVIPTNPFLAGFPFVVQGLVVSPSNTTRGNVTEAYRGRIFE